jgi:sterol desaturase/sphingolipid hydroxylase (fatty acid hydroxylase superfamily)
MGDAAGLPRRPLGRYSYPTSHRVIELLSIVSFVAFMAVFGRRVATSIGDAWSVGTALWVLLAAFAGFVTADFASGLVHGLCDNLGSVDTPIVGQKFIRSFREHHTDPLDMTTGDYVRTNADNFFACLFVLVPCVIWMDVGAHPYRAAFVVSLLLVVIMTNQIHKWAHLVHVGRPVPGVVRALQRSRVILSPEHHQIHHTPPYDTHYCITSGITNGPLARIGFWPVMMRSCRFVGRHLPGSPAVTGDTGPAVAEAPLPAPPADRAA